MVTKLFLCLVGLNHLHLFLVRADPHDEYPDVLNITDVVEMLENLSEEKQLLFADLSMVSTLCQVGANRIKKIQDIGIPRLKLWDQQQNEQIDDFKDQVKELTQRTDTARAICEQTRNRANTNQASVNDQANEVNDLQQMNDAQDSLIDEIAQNISDSKSDIMQRLGDTITDLNTNISDVSQDIEDIGEFVHSRRCEYGLTTLCPGETTEVTFKTTFDEVPSIAISLVGFSAHLDTQSPESSHDVDLLALNKEILNTSADGFNATVTGVDGDSVFLKHVYCSWMACQNLDETSSLCA